jgi:hypothetical protein
VNAFARLGGYDPVSLVAAVTCPVLGVYGGDDQGTPALENARLLQQAFSRVPGADRQVLVLPRTDDAFAAEAVPSWSAPLVPGDWHRDLVAPVSDWLAVRLRRRAGGTGGVTGPLQIPRAG